MFNVVIENKEMALSLGKITMHVGDKVDILKDFYPKSWSSRDDYSIGFGSKLSDVSITLFFDKANTITMMVIDF